MPAHDDDAPAAAVDFMQTAETGDDVGAVAGLARPAAMCLTGPYSVEV